MRILIISIYYRPEPVPKPHELAEGLSQRGHQVDVLTAFPNYPFGRIYPGYKLRPWKTETINGVRVVRLPIYPNHSTTASLRILTVLTFFFGVFLGGLFLLGDRPDLVYVWGNPPTSGLVGLMLSRLLGAKFVYGIHDLWPDLALETGMLRHGIATNIIQRLEDFILRHSDHSISISKGFTDRLIVRGAPEKRISIIPHWADESIYKPVARDERLASENGLDGRFVVMYAGNVGRMQGLDQLLGAALLLKNSAPDFLFLIIGDGVERPALREYAKDHTLHNVVFVDPQTPERVVTYAGLADVLFVGLIAGPLARLSIPSKVASCLASGKPLLSTVAGETADVIARTESGITCEPDASSIAAALRKLQNCSPEERTAMATNARDAFLREFSRDRLLGKHEELMVALSATFSRHS